MRAYSEAGEEALRARSLLKDWAGEGFIDPIQRQQMEQDTPCDLRRINIFLRGVMFFFTVLVVAAVVGFFFTPTYMVLVAAAASYAGAEIAAKRGFYRHGIEEAFAICSIALFCGGMFVLFDRVGNAREDGTEFMIPVAGVLASLWIWYRFGLAYVFLLTMMFIAWFSAIWSLSQAGQVLFLAALYATGLVAIILLRARHRHDYLNQHFSIAEALLWVGFYLAWNLQIDWMNLLREVSDGPRNAGDFSRAFYWTTYALTWLIPPIVLYRGVRAKDRLVIAAGGIAALLTLITNKPYLGWERHTWDGMILGAFLIALALLLQRWLNQGENGIRSGFTAKRLSGKDKGSIGIVSTIIGAAAPQITAVTPKDPDFQFGGGSSGGGGASGEF